MKTALIASRSGAAMAAIARVVNFLTSPQFAPENPDDPEVCDFTLGNPHEPVVPGFVAAIERQLAPHHHRWFAYNTGEPATIAAIAAGLRERLGLPFADADILLTSGAFAGLSVCLATLADPGDEVIFNSPPWFFYEPMILAQGLAPVRVTVDRQSFDLDLGAIEAAIGPRTRAVIVNSPNNPSGRVYRAAELAALGDVLRRASAEHGRPIVLLSDQSYDRILFDGVEFRTPALDYDATVTIYTYGKTLLAPGQRIGWVALHPSFPDAAAMNQRIFVHQLAAGWGFPNALLQHAIRDLESLSIDMAALQRRRDRLVPALRDLGYETTLPEGTFYVMARSPEPDDIAFADRLAAHGALVLPGSIVECPGWFRISLTASDAMVERGIEAFRTAREAVPA
jgi:aspartate aminotransferase